MYNSYIISKEDYRIYQNCRESIGKSHIDKQKTKELEDSEKLIVLFEPNSISILSPLEYQNLIGYWIYFTGGGKEKYAKLEKSKKKASVTYYTQKDFFDYLTKQTSNVFFKRDSKEILQKDPTEFFPHFSSPSELTVNPYETYGFKTRKEDGSCYFNLTEKIQFPLYSRADFAELTEKEREKAEQAFDVFINCYFRANVLFETEEHEVWTKDILSGLYKDPLREQYYQLPNLAFLGESGCGKTLLMELIQRSFGEFQTTQNSNFVDKFNVSEYISTPFVFIDELDSLKTKEAVSLYKKLSTCSGELLVEIKGRPAERRKVCCHFGITGNENTVFKDEEQLNRRTQFVYFVKDTIYKPENQDLFKQFSYYLTPNAKEYDYFAYLFSNYFLNRKVEDAKHLERAYLPKKFKQDRLDEDQSWEAKLTKLWLDRKEGSEILLTDKRRQSDGTIMQISEIEKDLIKLDRLPKNLQNNESYISERALIRWTHLIYPELRTIKKNKLKQLLKPIFREIQIKQADGSYELRKIYDISSFLLPDN